MTVTAIRRIQGGGATVTFGRTLDERHLLGGASTARPLCPSCSLAQGSSCYGRRHVAPVGCRRHPGGACHSRAAREAGLLPALVLHSNAARDEEADEGVAGRRWSRRGN